jgi:hypothetical protein
MAALSLDNLNALAQENSEEFGTKILPQVTATLVHLKDEEMLYHTAWSLEGVVS